MGRQRNIKRKDSEEERRPRGFKNLKKGFYPTTDKNRRIRRLSSSSDKIHHTQVFLTEKEMQIPEVRAKKSPNTIIRPKMKVKVFLKKVIRHIAPEIAQLRKAANKLPKSI